MVHRTECTEHVLSSMLMPPKGQGRKEMTRAKEPKGLKGALLQTGQLRELFAGTCILVRAGGTLAGCVAPVASSP